MSRPMSGPVAAHPLDILAIVFVTLWLTTASVAFAYYSQWNAADKRWKTATENVQARNTFAQEQDTIVDLQQTNAALKVDVLRLSNVAGGRQSIDAPTSIEVLAGLLNGVDRELKLGKTPIDPNSVSRQTDILTVNEAIRQLEARVANLLENQTDGVKVLEQKRAKLQGKMRESSGGDMDEARKREAEAMTKLNAKLDAARKKTTAQRRANTVLEQQLVGQRDGERRKVERALDLKGQLNTRLFQTTEKYKNRRAELLKTLKYLRNGRPGIVKQRKKDPRQPDGRIYSSSPDNDTCYINLARKDRLLEGLRFEVFRYKNGGKELPRARIQVIRVGIRMSKCRVLERWFRGRWYKMSNRRAIRDYVLREFKIDPLDVDDRIRNRLYDRTEMRRFVIAGKLTGPYKGEDIERLIRDTFADKVAELTDEQTDFIVLGLGYEKDRNYKRAIELGTPKLSERELLAMLGKY